MGILSWLKSFGGPDETLRTLMSTYEKCKAVGASDEEARLKMFSTRPGWIRLPKPFLLDLLQKLETPDNIFKLILLAEGHGILKNNIRRVAKTWDNCAWLVTTFTGLGNHLGKEARAVEAGWAFHLALQLNREYMPAMVGLGLLHYQEHMYPVAASYFEQALNSERRYREERKQRYPLEEVTEFGLPDVDLAILEQMYNECCMHARRTSV